VPMVSRSPSATHESSFSIGVWIYVDIGQMDTNSRNGFGFDDAEDGSPNGCTQVANLCTSTNESWL